jgi:hypothetical protein
MSINQDLWSAKLPNGDVRSGTLEQLNEAFRSGYLGESTLVRPARSDTWTKLADVLAGVAPGGAPTAAPAQPVPAPPVPASPADAGDAATAAPAQPVPTPTVPAPAANAGGVPTAAPAQPVPAPTVPSPAADARSASARINVRPELWQVRLANGEVGSGTYQQLEEAFDAGHLSEETFVLAAGTREWVRLGAIMLRDEPQPDVLVPSAPPQRPSAEAQPVASPAATAAATTPAQTRGHDELWQVRLADGQVRSGTRQQLEEAFIAGHLDENALVLAAGASEWATLGSLAGRDLSAPLPAPVASAEASSVEAQPGSPDAAPSPAAATASDDAEVGTPALDATPTGPAEDEKTDSQIAGGDDSLWEVKLTGKQLATAFHTGLLDDDALVLAAGTEQWRTLGDVRAAQSLPSRVPPAAKSSASALSS